MYTIFIDVLIILFSHLLIYFLYLFVCLLICSLFTLFSRLFMKLFPRHTSTRSGSTPNGSVRSGSTLWVLALGTLYPEGSSLKLNWETRSLHGPGVWAQCPAGDFTSLPSPPVVSELSVKVHRDVWMKNKVSKEDSEITAVSGERTQWEQFTRFTNLIWERSRERNTQITHMSFTLRSVLLHLCWTF